MKKTKYIAMSILIIIFLSIPVLVLAKGYQNEKNGFRDLTWGTSFETVQNQMALVEDFGLGKKYARKNDNLVIGDVRVKSILYVFNENNRLYAVMIKPEDDSWRALKMALTYNFGKPTPDEWSYSWEGEYTNIIIWKKNHSVDFEATKKAMNMNNGL